MAARSVLLAICIVARDTRVDAAALLDLWTRESSVKTNPLDRLRGVASAAVIDDLDRQPFLLAALRGTRAGVAVGCHLGTRVNGRSEDEPVELSVRSTEAARQLAQAATDGRVLVSDDLGAFLTIGRARLAPNLEATRVSVAGGPAVSAYRLRVATVPPTTVRDGTNRPVAALDEDRRSRLVVRLSAGLTPFLGPIAPVMLQQLPTGRMSAQELIDAVLRNVPVAQREPIRQVIEDEIRALR
jgi:hypothetical protein